MYRLSIVRPNIILTTLHFVHGDLYEAYMRTRKNPSEVLSEDMTRNTLSFSGLGFFGSNDRKRCRKKLEEAE